MLSLTVCTSAILHSPCSRATQSARSLRDHKSLRTYHHLDHLPSPVAALPNRPARRAPRLRGLAHAGDRAPIRSAPNPERGTSATSLSIRAKRGSPCASHNDRLHSLWRHPHSLAAHTGARSRSGDSFPRQTLFVSPGAHSHMMPPTRCPSVLGRLRHVVRAAHSVRAPVAAPPVTPLACCTALQRPHHPPVRAPVRSVRPARRATARTAHALR